VGYIQGMPHVITWKPAPLFYANHCYLLAFR